MITEDLNSVLQHVQIVNSDLRQLEKARKYELASKMFSYMDFNNKSKSAIEVEIANIFDRVDRFYKYAYKKNLTPIDGKYKD